MSFTSEFQERGILSKELGASFIALIPMKIGAVHVKDFLPISLIGSIYKMVAKVLAGRIKKVLPIIISASRAAFVQGRQILSGVPMAN